MEVLVATLHVSFATWRSRGVEIKAIKNPWLLSCVRERRCSSESHSRFPELACQGCARVSRVQSAWVFTADDSDG